MEHENKGNDDAQEVSQSILICEPQKIEENLKKLENNEQNNDKTNERTQRNEQQDDTNNENHKITENVENQEKNNENSSDFCSEIPKDSTFSPIPFVSGENPSPVEQFSGKSQSLFVSPSPFDINKPTIEPSLSDTQLSNILLPKETHILTPEAKIEETSEEQENCIDELIETLPSTRRLNVTPEAKDLQNAESEKPDDNRENEEQEETKQQVEEHEIDELLETLPSQRRPDLSPENEKEETHEEEEQIVKEQEIDDLLATLPSQRRIPVSREPVTPNNETKEEENGIDELLETLPSQRRVPISPSELSDNEGNEEEDDSIVIVKTREIPQEQSGNDSSQNDIRMFNDSPEKEEQNKGIFETEMEMPSLIASARVRPIYNYGYDESSDEEERKEDSANLTKFSKTGKLPPINDKNKLIREVQRERAEAVAEGDYDKADQLFELSKKVTTAIQKSEEEERKAELIRSLQVKLDTAKDDLFSVRNDSMRIINLEEQCEKNKLEELDQKHIDELTEFEERWNDEQFLRRFTKPSSKLIELKEIEERMVKTKRFKDAKIVRAAFNKLEQQESKEAQENAEREMKKAKHALIEKQKNENESAKYSAMRRIEIVKKSRADFESPYIRVVESLERRIKQAKESETVCNDSPIKTRSIISRPQTSMSATHKILQSRNKSSIPKLTIKPLGVTLAREKKRIIQAKQKNSSRK